MTTLDEVYAELERGRVWVCSLRDDRWHLDGLSHGENIYIDPKPSILETLVHELLHRRYPRWGERRVDREARRLVGSMDEPTKRRWWLAYLRIAKRRKPFSVDQ